MAFVALLAPTQPQSTSIRIFWLLASIQYSYPAPFCRLERDSWLPSFCFYFSTPHCSSNSTARCRRDLHAELSGWGMERTSSVYVSLRGGGRLDYIHTAEELIAAAHCQDSKLLLLLLLLPCCCVLLLLLVLLAAALRPCSRLLLSSDIADAALLFTLVLAVPACRRLLFTPEVRLCCVCMHFVLKK